MPRILAVIVPCLTILAGCATGASSQPDWFDQPEEALPIPPRHTTLVAETCALDAWQASALASDPVHRLVSEVILVCPTIRTTGDVAPLDPDARASLAQSVGQARAMGYQVRLGVTMGDDGATFPVPYSGARAGAAFADPTWHTAVLQNLAPFAAMADGLELDLIDLPGAARPDVTRFFTELDTAFRPATTLGVMAPPSTTDPSDTPGGDAFDLAQVSAHVDRVRMMTLDFSCCGTSPGPNIDPSWAEAVAGYALSKVHTPVDVAFPLYGTDFSSRGPRYVTFEEGLALAADLHVVPSRDASFELHFGWNDTAGGAHETWFEDGVSASRTLNTWNPSALPPAVGIVLYGLGAEDPALFETLARGLP